MSIKSSYTLTISLFAISILSGAVLSSTAFADTNTAQDNVSVSVPVSCTMNGTGMNSHTTNIPNGTYESEIGTTTLKSFCNDSQGFAIYAIGYTNEEYGNTTLIGANQGQTIVTGTATTTGNPDVSNWAVKLETSSGATYPLTLDNGFGSYSSVPSSYTKVAHRDSGTDLGSSATGTELTTTYAAYISKTQKADIYDGKVKFTLVHPSDADTPTYPIACEAGKICYNANAATTVGEMGKQNLVKARDWSSCFYTDYQSVCYDEDIQQVDINTLPELDYYVDPTLWASNFKRSGYGFAGWNTEPDYSGTNYGPQQTITVPASAETDGLPLYAIWVKSAGDMQNWNGCSSLAQGAVTALKDSRDNDVYAVAKLADNKCWMIESLRLDNTPELTLANTHNPALPLTNNDSTSSYYLSPTTSPANWCHDSSAVCIDQSMLATDNTTLFINNTASNYDAESNVYSYGNYYNWYSATGGHGKYSVSTRNYSVEGDLCPIGWRLPIGGDANNLSNNDYAQMDLILGGTGTAASQTSAVWRSYPNNFVYSGQLYTYGIVARDGSGDYWTSTASQNSTAYYFGVIGKRDVTSGTTPYGKSIGGAVRCVIDTQ